MRLISNSEVGTWLDCRRKYWFEYILDLEPKRESGPITKGTLIHAMLEPYYIGKADGWSEEDCREASMEPLMVAASSEIADIADLGATRNLVMAYFDHYMEEDERYEVVAVETKMMMEMSERHALVGTIDLVWRDLEDGRIIIVDHKSSYNFWSEDQINIAGQLSKYVALGRAAGLDVKAGMINQLRTRPLKEGNELFRRAITIPTEVKLRSVMEQHLMASDEIVDFRENAVKIKAIPRYDKFACANCAFLNLCDSESNGAPIQYQIQQDFQVRERYGYELAVTEGETL